MTEPNGAPEPGQEEEEEEQEDPKRQVAGDVVKVKAPTLMGARGIVMRTTDDLIRVCKWVSGSGLAPRGIDTPQKVFVVVEQGLELGWSLMQSLQNLYVIHGRIGMYGQAALAQVRASGQTVEYDEWFEVDGKRIPYLGDIPDIEAANVVAVTKSLRRGMSKPVITRYGVAEAKRARLWGKVGKSGEPSAWVTSPGRMLQMRSRGMNLKDNFSDVLCGLSLVEELRDVEVEVVDTPSALTHDGSKQIPEKTHGGDTPVEAGTPEPEQGEPEVKAPDSAATEPVAPAEPEPEELPEAHEDEFQF